MKKINSVIIIIALLFQLCPATSYAGYDDVYDYDTYYTSVNRLQDLGIISGYPDGLFHADRAITRAEFAKVIVCAMDAEAEAKTYGIASRFYDVPQGNWAVPYIAYVTSKGIVAGYPDGSFGPSNTITYAEALTIIGKMLGYTEETIGSYWPNNYIDTAASTGITSGINFYSNQELNRAMASMIVDRALFTEVNTSGQNSSSQSSGEKPILLELLGYSIIEDALILSTSSDDDSLFDGEIKLSDNKVYSSTIKSPVNTGDTLKYAVISKDGDMVCVKHYGEENAENEKNRYTVLENCYIIASASEDRTLSQMEIRTSRGVFTVNDSSILNKVGEVGKLVLNKEKTVLSASTKDAFEQEYIVSDTDSSGIKFVNENSIKTLNLASDFPVYVDYKAKDTFENANKKFTSGSILTLYSADGGNWSHGVLDTNSGYSVKNECFIIASKNEDHSLSANQVKTSDGTYTVSDTNMLSLVGSMGTIILNDQHKIEQFAPTDMVSQAVVVNKVNGANIDYTGIDGSKGSFRFDNTFITYLDYGKSTYAQTQGSITAGTALTFYGDNRGSWRFAVIDEGDDIKPALASHDYSGTETDLEGIIINHDNLTVYRDGNAATLADIEKNDVVYYNKRINTMDVYTKKITGIYYDAQPSKAYVTDVTVGGKTYKIGEASATVKLDASAGSFNIGDKVTLLLGKNDEVVFAVELSGFNYFDYGVVVSAGKRIAQSGANEGSSETYVSVFMPDGEIYEYVADKDYTSYKGKLVSIKYENSRVKLNTINTSTKPYGKINYSERTIGSKTVLKDVKIIQRLSDENSQEVQLETLSFETLEASELMESNIISAVTANKFGDIGLLYITGVSGGLDYGVFKSKSGTESAYTYKIYSNGAMNEYTSYSNYGVSAGVAVSYRASDRNITSVSRLFMLDSSKGVDAVEGSRIMLGGRIYKMYSDVQIVDIRDRNNYKTMTIDELSKCNNSTVSVYSENSKDGVVRVVVVG